MKRTPIRRVSAKRAIELKEYTVKRKAFLITYPTCIACGDKKSTDVHHIHGRLGGNYLNEATWMAVCRHCHHFRIHGDPSQARAKGWMV